MTNRELQELLRKYHDDMQIELEDQEAYSFDCMQVYIEPYKGLAPNYRVLRLSGIKP